MWNRNLGAPAQLYDRGDIGIGDEFIHESIIGTFFRSVIVEEQEMETQSAVITKITGSAFVTALNTLQFEHNDPLRTGFRL
jgi:proline racemase